jgi:hypothetical protein
MTPIEKAKWLAEFYGAVAAGKTVQTRENGEWIDVRFEPHATNYAPNMMSNYNSWRIKPEPRRMWTCVSPDKQASHNTEDKDIAIGLMASRYTVTEWQEVV